MREAKKIAGVAGPSIILIVALVMLFASLAALLLANSLRGQLQETRGQLEQAQGELQDARSKLQNVQEAGDRQQKTNKGGAGPAGKQPGTVNKSQPQDNTKGLTGEGQGQQRAMLIWMQEEDTSSSLPYLLLLTLGLVVLASFMMVVTSALTLLSGGSRSGKPGNGASTLSHTGTSNLERASPLEDKHWMKLVEECVEVVDDLDEHMESFDAPRREVAGHVMLRLEEALGRSGVDVISNEAIFDRARHKPDADHAATDNDAAVYETLSPGFAVGPRVLRRARVRLKSTTDT